MSTAPSPLDLNALSVASPCSADWNRMQGDDKVRFCDACKLNVYNLSALTADEASRFVETREGRTCIRFFRRADGTILTQDCPEGLVALARRARLRTKALLASATLALIAWLGQSDWGVRTLQKWPPARRWMAQLGVTEPGTTRFVIPPAWKSRLNHDHFGPGPGQTVAPDRHPVELKGEMVAPRCDKPAPGSSGR